MRLSVDIWQLILMDMRSNIPNFSLQIRNDALTHPAKFPMRQNRKKSGRTSFGRDLTTSTHMQSYIRGMERF